MIEVFIDTIDFQNKDDNFYSQIEKWINSNNSSPFLFYKLFLYSFEQNLSKLTDLLYKYEEKFKYNCIANHNNQEYNKLFIQGISIGSIEYYDLLKNLEVVYDKNINKLLTSAISSKNEKLAIKIYEEKNEICIKKKLNNLFLYLEDSLKLNFYDLFKTIYKDHIKDLLNTDNFLVEKLFNIISLKGELHLVKFIFEETPSLFKINYEDIVVNSISYGYLDIFDYCVEKLEITILDNDDKLSLLNIALYTKNIDIFSIVYELISPVDLTHPRLELLQKSKSINQEIFSFLYTEADNQIRGYTKL